MITDILALPEAHLGCILGQADIQDQGGAKKTYAAICSNSDTDGTENRARDTQVLYGR